MPIPSPKEKEKEDEFMGRCISALSHSDPDRPKKQRIAVCYSAWRDKKKKEVPELTPEERERRKARWASEILEAFEKMDANYFVSEEVPESEIEKEMKEHPWATREQAKRIAEDHAKLKKEEE